MIFLAQKTIQTDVRRPSARVPHLPRYLRLGERSDRGFTLVEMLVVMGIIVLLISLVTPAVTSLQGASNVNRAVYDVSGLLSQARAYALTNRVYVYVGIAEVDMGQSESAVPKVAGVGRIVMAVIASKDGTSGYDISNVAGTWPQLPGSSAFAVIGKKQTFDNLHLVNLGQRPDSGKMVRPPYSNSDPTDPKYNLGDASCLSATSFNYPLGAPVASAEYTFSKVVQFSPQGVARIQRADNSDVVVPWLEIGLQQSYGGIVKALPSPATTGNIAAIQINGVTGVARIYRP